MRAVEDDVVGFDLVGPLFPLPGARSTREAEPVAGTVALTVGMRWEPVFAKFTGDLEELQ